MPVIGSQFHSQFEQLMEVSEATIAVEEAIARQFLSARPRRGQVEVHGVCARGARICTRTLTRHNRRPRKLGVRNRDLDLIGELTFLSVFIHRRSLVEVGGSFLDRRVGEGRQRMGSGVHLGVTSLS